MHCVVLQIGLYVIGNFEVLRQSGSLLEAVINAATAQGIMGDGLPLVCQNHPRDEGIVASTAKDFRKVCVGGGGCMCVWGVYVWCVWGRVYSMMYSMVKPDRRMPMMMMMMWGRGVCLSLCECTCV